MDAPDVTEAGLPQPGWWWPPPGRLRVGAHRGDSETAPENTFAAFEAAAAAGVDYVETDVRCTADGVAVVLHDDTLDRTTDATGPVAGVRSTDLARVDAGGWFSPTHVGQSVPTLEALLAWASDPAAPAAMLEAKAPGTGAVIAARSAGATPALRHKLALCSFDPGEIFAAKRVDPALPCFLVLERAPAPPDLVQRVRACGADGTNVSWRWVGPALVEDLHNAGLSVAAGTADDPTVVGSLVGLGVDFVDSERPRLAVAGRAGAEGAVTDTA